MEATERPWIYRPKYDELVECLKLILDKDLTRFEIECKAQQLLASLEGE